MLKKVIEGYVPYNSREEKDKEVMLTYVDTFDDIFTRNNEIGHITVSSWIVNKDRDKVLLVHHNIYNSWGWTGGHADGEEDLLKVAIKEACEETGVKSFKPVTGEVFAIDIVPCPAHVKRGKDVAAHLHLNFTYLLEADESEELVVCENENSGVKWFPIKDMESVVREELMLPIYNKFNTKIYELGL